MTRDITGADSEHLLDEGWSTPLEAGVRGTIRGFIETLLEEELEAALGRARYARLRNAAVEQEATARGLGNEEPAAATVPSTGHRHGRRERQVMGSFGAIEVAVPRARLDRADGLTTEWVNKTLPAYRRRTREVDALIAGAYLAGTNTRRVGRALAAVFRGAISKSTVSRVWRKIKADWESWNRRDLASEDIVRLILDGTVVKVRLDKKATAISLLVVLGVRRDGQKVLLAVKNMGGESEAAWRGVLDDLTRRGLKTPELAIVDGAPGLEKALLALWPDLPVQRCTVHKLRNLIAHAPKRLADEIAADYADMIYADNTKGVEKRRKAFLRKWRDKCEAVATSLEEAGDKLFTFTRLPVEQWKSARTTNAIERLHLEFKRRIKTQTVLPSAETAAMLFWALLASGQIVLRKVDGWMSIARPLAEPIDLAA
ncbi:MAG TPA: IS256 family transposase [Hyphomicrobiaceae bacterium]|nr:IS256 family transposase [Hyphomicrobiaceae bacterium]